LSYDQLIRANWQQGTGKIIVRFMVQKCPGEKVFTKRTLIIRSDLKMNLETPYEWWVLFMEGIKSGAYECGVLTSQFLSIGIIIYTAIHDIGLILETSV
jgi:hypothetical protein